MEPCDRCPGWARSSSNVWAVLEQTWPTCPTCKEQATMRTVSLQYKAKMPQWWVVNGKNVIPMWIVEEIRVMQFTEQ